MNSLVLGKNSAVGSTLQRFSSGGNYLFLDRAETREILREDSGFQKFLTRNSVDKVIYLLVDRNTRLDEAASSTFNFQFPIQIAEAISERESVDFVWPSSIFCLDDAMTQINPYLLSQNLAFERIRAIKSLTNSNYARIYFPQIYGNEIYRKHQPFLYKIRDLLQKGFDVQLINGKSTFRNFVHESDIPNILADSKNWVQKTEVTCLFEESLSWFEIAELIRISFKSKSKILDQSNESVKYSEYKYSNLGAIDIGAHYDLSNIQKAIDMGMF